MKKKAQPAATRKVLKKAVRQKKPAVAVAVEATPEPAGLPEWVGGAIIVVVLLAVLFGFGYFG